MALQPKLDKLIEALSYGLRLNPMCQWQLLEQYAAKQNEARPESVRKASTNEAI